MMLSARRTPRRLSRLEIRPSHIHIASRVHLKNPHCRDSGPGPLGGAVVNLVRTPLRICAFDQTPAPGRENQNDRHWTDTEIHTGWLTSAHESQTL